MQVVKHTDKLVSVIMPAYNAALYINDAINSVIKQTYTSWELIVVDDGSEDKTAEIVKNLIKTDPRINYLYQNRGRQGKARNLAIKNSNGNYIAFLDADDTWVNYKLQTQIDILESRPDIDLVFSQGYNLLPDNTCTEIKISVQKWCWGNDSDTFITANQIPTLSVLTRRKAIEDVGLFTETTEIQNGAEDYHLWIKMLKNGNFLSISDKLFYYRIHPQQVTYKNNNTEIAIAACLFDLTLSGVINFENKSVRHRLKWLIFYTDNVNHYIKMLKGIFPEKATILSALLFLNRFLPGTTFAKKLTVRCL